MAVRWSASDASPTAKAGTWAIPAVFGLLSVGWIGWVRRSDIFSLGPGRLLHGGIVPGGSERGQVPGLVSLPPSHPDLVYGGMLTARARFRVRS